MTIAYVSLLLNQLEEGIHATRRVNYCNVASVTIMILDWLLTFDAEVSFIWNSRWNATKVLYLVARYLPFIDTSVVMYHQFGYALPQSVCRLSYQYASFAFVLGIGFSELIFTLRTWAMWEKGRWLTLALFGTFSAIWFTELIIIGVYIAGATHEVSLYPRLIGCISRGKSTPLSADYILLMAYDTGIMILMIIRGISTFKLGRGGSGSRLIQVVYTEGVMYYIYLFGLAFLNIVIILKLSGSYINLLIMVQRVIHSVLACRVILHIRKRLSEEPPIPVNARGGLGGAKPSARSEGDDDSILIIGRC